MTDRPTLPVVAIDGPAASGKSSTANRVAQRLGLVHIDSGALYRTATWLALRGNRIAQDDVVQALEVAMPRLLRDGSSATVHLDGVSMEAHIRTPDITERVSEVSAMPLVRDWVNRRLRAAVDEWGGAVMDGRDIGTVVFPDAALKVFLTATPEARAVRRLRQSGGGVPTEEIAREASRLGHRDRLDADRAVAPLRAAEDARRLDTTLLTLDQQVDRIVEWATELGLSAS
ncbi:MAG: (d)CMP kinase [Gemmatimonadota bacterium]